MAKEMSKRSLKKSFETWFEDIDLDLLLEYNLELLPVRTDIILDCFEFDLATNIQTLSDNCLLNLFAFKSGVSLLSKQIDLLISRDILQYLFSSPFMDEESLLALLMDQRVIDSSQDIYLEHLARNPNIYD